MEWKPHTCDVDKMSAEHSDSRQAGGRLVDCPGAPPPGLWGRTRTGRPTVGTRRSHHQEAWRGGVPLPPQRTIESLLIDMGTNSYSHFSYVAFMRQELGDRHKVLNDRMTMLLDEPGHEFIVLQLASPIDKDSN